MQPIRVLHFGIESDSILAQQMHLFSMSGCLHSVFGHWAPELEPQGMVGLAFTKVGIYPRPTGHHPHSVTDRRA